MSNLLCFVISLILYCQNVTCDTYYCVDGSTVSIQGETNGTVHTVVTGQTIYGNNLDCSWVIDGGQSSRIQLRILFSDLQYAPTYVSCGGYDHLSIRDGSNKDLYPKASICGEFNPHEVVSTGQYLHLNFFSNDKNFYDHQGIKLEFKVFTNTDCPPSWRSNSSVGDCYRIMEQPTGGAIWEDAQRYCGYSQSNLATYNTIASYQFIQDYGSEVGIQKAWIGLNDIVHEGDYRWLNDSTLSSDVQNKLQTCASLDDCIVHSFTSENLQCQYCSREKIPFVCLQKRDGSTVVYRAPDSPIETDVHRPIHSQAWKLTVVAVSCMILGICLYTFIRHRKQQLRRKMDNTIVSYSYATQQLEPLTSGISSEPSTIHLHSLENFTSIQRSEPVQPSAPPPSYDEAIAHGSLSSKT